MSGMKVAESVISPEVEESFSIPQVHSGDDTQIKIMDWLVNENSPLIGRNIDSIGEEISQLIIVGAKKQDHSFIFNPTGQYVFEAGDTVVSMGELEACTAAVEKFDLSYNPEQTLSEAA